jgi:hypothetical protein
VADAVAKHVGIRVARGDLLPEQKVAAIAELARSTSGVAAQRNPTSPHVEFADNNILSTQLHA